MTKAADGLGPPDSERARSQESATGVSPFPSSSDEYLLASLRSTISAGRVLFVLGAGVAASVTENSKASSWKGLLELGIVRVRALRRRDEQWCQDQLAALTSTRSDDLISVADAISEALHAPHGSEFSIWLRETVGQLQPLQPQVVEAISCLGGLIATTNYDTLIEQITNLPSVSWKETPRIEEILSGAYNAVLHLHGYWRSPSSVVFGQASYDKVRTHKHVQAVLHTLCMTHSLVFVGFGAGLGDPNMGPLIEWMRETLKESERRHFRLARTSEVDAIAQLLSDEDRIFVLSYGDQYDDLAPFLDSLRPAPEATDVSPLVNIDQPASRQIQQIPYDSKPGLVGRDDSLRAISALLQSSELIRPRKLVLSGMHGIGKTRLAIEYAHCESSKYELIWWINGESRETLDSDAARLAIQLGLVNIEDGIESALNALKAWLSEARSRWLLVLDDIHPSLDSSGVIPSGGNGDILFTSTNPNWPIDVQFFEVQTLSTNDATRFLLDGTKQYDEQVAEQIALELGGLPLALEQVVAFVRARNLSLAGYFERLVERRSDLLNRGEVADHRVPITATLGMSFDAVSREAPPALDLLYLLSFLAPDNIPVAVLRAGASTFPKGLAEVLADELRFDDAVVTLRSYTLVHVESDDSLGMHRLVQSLAREQLNSATQRAYISGLTAALLKAMPNNPQLVETWPRVEGLVAHVLAVIGHSHNLDADDFTTSGLLNDVGMYMLGRGAYQVAKEMFERSLAIRRRGSNPNLHGLSIVLNNLGLVLHEIGDDENSLARFSESLSVYTTSSVQDDKFYVDLLNNIAGSYLHNGQVDLAKDYFEQLVDLQKSIYSEDDPRIAVGLSNLASALQRPEDLKRAESLVREALRISRRAYGSSHPDVAVRLANLALIRAKNGETVTALAHYREALRIDELAYGPNHPALGVDLDNLAGIYAELGDLGAARDLLTRAVALREASLGKTSRKLLDSLLPLAPVLLQLSEIPAASEAYARALAIAKLYSLTSVVTLIEELINYLNL